MISGHHVSKRDPFNSVSIAYIKAGAERGKWSGAGPKTGRSGTEWDLKKYGGAGAVREAA